MIRIFGETSPNTFAYYELPTAVDLARPLTQDEAWAVLEAAFVATGGRWIGILPGLTIDRGAALLRVTPAADTLGVSPSELESWLRAWREDERTTTAFQTAYITDLVSIGGGPHSPTEVLQPYLTENPWVQQEKLRFGYPEGELLGELLEPLPLDYFRYSRTA